MKKEDIHLNDIHRILFGQAPTAFMVEVLIRVAIVYLALLIVLKLMGKRMDGQISIVEMAVMIVFGAIVGVGTQLPERGILMALTAFACVFVLQRGINWLNLKSATIEKATNGTLSILVKDGILQLPEMKATRMSRQNLFAALRGQRIYNLGKVRRVYFETCGHINIYQYTNDRPGLAVLPHGELDFVRTKTHLAPGFNACTRCGLTTSTEKQNQPCANCGGNEWMEAIF